MNDPNPTLSCTITLEKDLLKAQSKKTYKSANLRLIRNQYQELLIEMDIEKSKQKFLLKDFTVHNKFMNEGKASIKFKQSKISLMISNAPPSKLLEFLRIIYIKLQSKDTNEKTPRTKMLASKKSVCDEISPITLVEFQNAKQKAKLINPSIASPLTKKRLALNDSPQQAKKQCLMTNPSQMTDEQLKILTAVTSGINIFFTGSAGTGKSYLLRKIINSLPPESTIATASTGVAAFHIGGTTLHSFAGIGLGRGSLQQCIQKAQRPQVKQIWRKTKHLIIDEISMVEGSFFEKLEGVARAIFNNDKPFGGIQLIICGDFLQLPPVSANDKMNSKFCFQTIAWSKCISKSFELKKVYRQKEREFVDILNNIRIGRVTEEITNRLMSTSKQKIEISGILASRLCTHTSDADNINRQRLEELEGEIKIFSAKDSNPEHSDYLDQQTPVVKVLRLKVGAQVMLLKNQNLTSGLVNGARGVVSGFSYEGYPNVRFRNKLEVEISPERWVVKSVSGGVMNRQQLPLKLAWAFSIHKSQGLTLDCVEMSLSRVFEPGQAYVALSRAQSLDSLRVLDFDSKQVWANPDVLKFYRNFRRELENMEIVPVKKKFQKKLL